MKIFEKLELWLDPVPRPGPEAMAVDEWLLDTATWPVLRVYHWQGQWGSLGYFGSVQSARDAFPGLDLVRRWSGGGMVDHRSDWTYSLVVPRGHPLAESRGAESYRSIHLCLMAALEDEGITGKLSNGDDQTGAGLCFLNPVDHDLVDPHGRKIAGAGQRRSLRGLLHQGSVAVASCSFEASLKRGRSLADRMSSGWKEAAFSPSVKDLEERVERRYGCLEWTERR